MNALKLQVLNEDELQFVDVDCSCGETSLSKVQVPTVKCLQQKIIFIANILAVRYMLLNKEYFTVECAHEGVAPCYRIPEDL